MRIAIPVAGGRLSGHFGRCETIALIDVDLAGKRVESVTEVATNGYQHGLLPPFLKQQGVAVVIAGGIGAGAASKLEAASIGILAGAPGESAAALAEQYLAGKLKPLQAACGHHGGCGSGGHGEPGSGRGR
ncbi:MAG: hypothetical protein MUC42_17010 [Bryobacter sp.]|nr:hypothetical protein [Bryobacter sp.]